MKTVIDDIDLYLVKEEDPTAVKNDVHADMHIQAVDVQYVFFEVKHHDIHALFVWIISHQPALRFSQNKPAISKQYFSLRTNQHQSSLISHQPNEQAVCWTSYQVLHIYNGFIVQCSVSVISPLTERFL
jgi:hypothetical protein